MVLGKRRILSCVVVVTAACSADGGGAAESSTTDAPDPAESSSGDVPTDESSGDLPGTTTDHGTTLAETGSESTSAAPESSSDSTGDVPVGDCHQAATHPWAGALCGTTEVPCRILEEVVLDPAPAVREFEHGRYSPSAITHDGACSPIVSYGATTSLDDATAVLARRDAEGEWSRVDREGVHRTSIAWDSALGVVRLLDETNGGDAAHRTYDGTAFAAQPTPPGIYGDAESLGNGRWHAVTRDAVEDDRLHVMQFADDAWTDTPIDTTQVFDATLASSDTDEAHVLMRVNDGERWRATYVAPPYDVQEPAFDAGSSEGVVGWMFLAMSGATPHVIATRTSPDTGWGELVYATRDGVGDWSVRTLASAESNADTGCGSPEPGAPTCEFVYVGHRAQHVVASHGGDVRLLWSERLTTGTAEVTCPEPEMPCVWTPTEQDETVTVWISSPTADGFDTTMLVDRELTVEDVEVDGTGAIHVVGSTREETGSRVEYLRLGE